MKCTFSSKKSDALQAQNINTISCNDKTNNFLLDNAKLQDHDYIVQPHLSQFSKQVVIYVSGFVALLKLLKCEICSFALTGANNNLENTFLAFKNQNFGNFHISNDIDKENSNYVTSSLVKNIAYNNTNCDENYDFQTENNNNQRCNLSANKKPKF